MPIKMHEQRRTQLSAARTRRAVVPAVIDRESEEKAMDAMSDTSIVRLWRGQPRKFQLLPNSLLKIEQQYGLGPMQIIGEIGSRSWRLTVVYAVIYHALIGAGGGMEESASEVEKGLTGCLVSHLQLAVDILTAAVIGNSDDELTALEKTARGLSTPSSARKPLN